MDKETFIPINVAYRESMAIFNGKPGPGSKGTFFEGIGLGPQIQQKKRRI